MTASPITGSGTPNDHARERGTAGAHKPVARPVNLRADLAQNADVVDAGGGEAIRQDERLGVGLSQDVLDLEGRVAAVARHSDCASLGDAQVGHVPLDAIRHPEHDVVAGPDAERQEPQGEGIGARLELGVGHALALEDDRLLRRIPRGRLVQHLPERQRGAKAARHPFVASICSDICRARSKAAASSSCDNP
jgi:hypothetical protein